MLLFWFMLLKEIFNFNFLLSLSFSVPFISGSKNCFFYVASISFYSIDAKLILKKKIENSFKEGSSLFLLFHPYFFVCAVGIVHFIQNNVFLPSFSILCFSFHFLSLSLLRCIVVQANVFSTPKAWLRKIHFRFCFWVRKS